MYLSEIDEKFKKVLNLVYFLSVVKNNEQVTKEKKSEKDLEEHMFK